MLARITSLYGLPQEGLVIEPIGSGLIHRTWKIIAGNAAYILQKINDRAFQKPVDIAANINLTAGYLRIHFPEYLFVSPLRARNGEDLIHQKDEGYFRLFPFVKGSQSKDVVETSQQAFEAAAQFGKLTRLLAGFKIEQLKLTIPCFHDLGLRYQQFLNAVEGAENERRVKAASLIQDIASHADIVSFYQAIIHDPEFKLRVTHHDTKISNVLFGPDGRGLCVIDLDTLMPGYFISDVGDMMRTYLSPVEEDDKRLERVEVREDIYRAIVCGYYKEMQNELTEKEKAHFFYAGKFMIYMQSLRFLTDYLQRDVYYGERYRDQNLIRARNQLQLLECLIAKEPVLASYCS